MIYVDPLIRFNYNNLLNNDRLFGINLRIRLSELNQNILSNKTIDVKIETYDNGVVILSLDFVKNDIYITKLLFEGFQDKQSLPSI